MDWRKITFFTCAASLLVGGGYPLTALLSRQKTPFLPAGAPILPKAQPLPLQEVARSITVKVLAEDSLGSGILIRRQGRVYTVLTNDHVLQEGNQYRIQTPDGRHYPAKLLAANFGGNDLGLLQFHSTDTNYRVASLGSATTLAVGEQVFASGFPIQAVASGKSKRANLSDFAFTSGQVTLANDKTLEGGYSVGYTNDIHKGMSGGPVLNSMGEVVAINGMHAYPLWGDPYVYKNGSKPCLPMRQLMSESSWGIPMETFRRLAPKTLALLPLGYLPSATSAKLSRNVSHPTQLMQQKAEAAKSCRVPF